MEKDPTPFEHEQDTQYTHVNKDDEITVPVKQEELTATKRQTERGSVHINKDVVEERQTLDVPVTDEEAHVSRRTVDRETNPAATAFEEETISVPIRGEEVDLEKRTHVSEEIDISRGAVTHNEHVSGTVRHEEVVIDSDGDVVRNSDAKDSIRQ